MSLSRACVSEVASLVPQPSLCDLLGNIRGAATIPIIPKPHAVLLWWHFDRWRDGRNENEVLAPCSRLRVQTRDWLGSSRNDRNQIMDRKSNASVVSIGKPFCMSGYPAPMESYQHRPTLSATMLALRPWHYHTEYYLERYARRGNPCK